ncbi:hypothetical protein [Streptomyces shenzhenensis]|uniref:hypothetical protein n=1 Tax=Streptomyces shenzhenensis TaxID=943815 RepID=UPI001F1619A6|nr:hypothetical protein [Streptomyces shenzhenensis]
MATATAAPAAFRAALRTQAAEPPAAGVPAWLWRLATAVHGELAPPAADAWANRLHALLGTARIPAGLRPVHVWQAETVLPLLAGTADTAVPAALHRAAARGAPADRDTWRSALGPLLLRLHDAAYDRAGAYAEGHAGARDHALANRYSTAEADAYGHEYARLSTEANARAFAEAHAAALGTALATAYSADDPVAYAATFPGAHLKAALRATAAAPGEAAPTQLLADGLLRALAACPP